MAGWNETHAAAFYSCETALVSQVTLTYRDPSQRFCINTDACDDKCSGIATQIPSTDVDHPPSEQQNAPLAFLSGRCTVTKSSWAVLEKEVWAVVATLTRLHWLVSTPDVFDLFTDHNKIIFIFDPLSILPDLSTSSVGKVLR